MPLYPLPARFCRCGHEDGRHVIDSDRPHAPAYCISCPCHEWDPADDRTNRKLSPEERERFVESYYMTGDEEERRLRRRWLS